jgi:UDP-glucose:glycoprotein glucosyltransferase
MASATITSRNNVRLLYLMVNVHSTLNEWFHSESAALENPDSFFPLVDALTNPEILPSPPPTTPEAIHAFALSVIEGYPTGHGSLESLVANLALHTSTPKIQAFYQYYVDHDMDTRRQAAAQGAECGSWVDWYGDVVCDVETLARLAGTETVDSTENRTSS